VILCRRVIAMSRADARAATPHPVLLVYRCTARGFHKPHAGCFAAAESAEQKHPSMMTATEPE
jgi:hypothetical protein